jgi:hypothetical protein
LIPAEVALSPNITQVVERMDLSAKDAKNAKGAKKPRVGVLLASLSFASLASFADK